MQSLIIYGFHGNEFHRELGDQWARIVTRSPNSMSHRRSPTLTILCKFILAYAYALVAEEHEGIPRASGFRDAHERIFAESEEVT